jgi:hypothetical protein
LLDDSISSTQTNSRWKSLKMDYNSRAFKKRSYGSKQRDFGKCTCKIA